MGCSKAVFLLRPFVPIAVIHPRKKLTSVTGEAVSADCERS